MTLSRKTNTEANIEMLYCLYFTENIVVTSQEKSHHTETRIDVMMTDTKTDITKEIMAVGGTRRCQRRIWRFKRPMNWELNLAWLLLDLKGMLIGQCDWDWVKLIRKIWTNVMNLGLNKDIWNLEKELEKTTFWRKRFGRVESNALYYVNYISVMYCWRIVCSVYVLDSERERDKQM